MNILVVRAAQVSLCNGILKDIPRQLAEHTKKGIKEWVEEELHIFDNKTIGDGLQLGRRNKKVNVCVRLLSLCLSF